MNKKLEATHDILLRLLVGLPESEAEALRLELNSIYTDVVLSHSSYEAIASQIRVKASVQKRKIKSRIMEDNLC